MSKLILNRQEILEGVKHFFDIEELVCRHTLAHPVAGGDKAWQFLDTDYLHTLLVIRRDIIQKPMYCNSHGLNQRGLRCNLCPIVEEKKDIYLSSHILGKAGDFTVSGMTAEEARQKIKQFAHRLPCNIRLEGGVSWLHIDVLPQYSVTEKVYIFTA